eukprot:6207727-Pleurochrysis_carterae.AAC.1
MHHDAVRKQPAQHADLPCGPRALQRFEQLPPRRRQRRRQQRGHALQRARRASAAQFQPPSLLPASTVTLHRHRSRRLNA